MRRSPSCEWHEWEEMLDDFSTVSGLLGIDTSMDGVDLDQLLLATADDFLEPFAGSSIAPNSPLFAANQEFLYEKEQDLKMLRAVGCDVQSNGEVLSVLEDKLEPQMVLQEKLPVLPTTTMGSTGHCHRKRKTAELYKCRDEADNSDGEEGQETGGACCFAWNTGGIEDLEEIADDVYDDNVTLVSPDYAEGLHGVEAVLSYWGLLLDAFPDGMMEDYIIQRDESSTEEMKATWTFSGTQIFPIFGVEPRHKKVCISGKSLFIFKGDRIRQIVLSWNYGETLRKLMGVQPEDANSVVPNAAASTTNSQCEVNQ
ncbi:unnamed protein product [Peronospora destructor]|uniref:SnoaL-like domain-containing protein n=1 Tax=Peronospora destructor TaxID=86335 RepID=A0AAV0V7H6_9STRA|nr:unnamed protein product [Peronospora destructor]